MPGTNQAWRCTVCGYVHHGAEPPEGVSGLRGASGISSSRSPISTLRTVQDARQSWRRAGSVEIACIGGGLLGLETAGGLARQGADVTLLEGHGGLLPRGLLRVVVEMSQRPRR